jgi:hypothetical protein
MLRIFTYPLLSLVVLFCITTNTYAQDETKEIEEEVKEEIPSTLEANTTKDKKFKLPNIDFSSLTNNARYGVRLQVPTMSWYIAESDSITGTLPRFALDGGLLYEKAIWTSKTERLFLSSGLYTTSVGGQFKSNTDTDTTLKTKLRIRYWQIPIALRYQFKQRNNFVPFVRLGVSPAVSFNTRYDQNVVNPEINNDRAGKLTQPFNLFYTLGVGTEHYHKDRHFLYGLSYNRGTFNIVTDNDNKAIKNHHIALSVSMFFGKTNNTDAIELEIE